MTTPQQDAVAEAMRVVLDGFSCPSPDDEDGQETWCGGCRNAVLDLIAAVRQDAARDFLEAMSLDPESAVAAQMARHAAIEDCITAIGDISDSDDGRGSVIGWHEAVRTLRALQENK